MIVSSCRRAESERDCRASVAIDSNPLTPDRPRRDRGKDSKHDRAGIVRGSYPHPTFVIVEINARRSTHYPGRSRQRPTATRAQHAQTALRTVQRRPPYTCLRARVDNVVNHRGTFAQNVLQNLAREVDAGRCVMVTLNRTQVAGLEYDRFQGRYNSFGPGGRSWHNSRALAKRSRNG